MFNKNQKHQLAQAMQIKPPKLKAQLDKNNFIVHSQASRAESKELVENAVERFYKTVTATNTKQIHAQPPQ